MIIKKIKWSNDRIDHIARHYISPEEVEEAVFDDPCNLIQVLKAAERDQRQKIYRLLGVSGSGKYITFIFIYEKSGVAYPVTAREMDNKERRRYLERQ